MQPLFHSFTNIRSSNESLRLQLISRLGESLHRIGWLFSAASKDELTKRLQAVLHAQLGYWYPVEI